MTGSGLRSPASNHCLASLDLGADAEQPFDCLIFQKRQAMQSMKRSVDWTLEDNMVDGLFCATLTGRRRGHTPFVIRTHAVLGRAIPGGLVLVSVMTVRSLVGLSNRFAFHQRSSQCAPLLLLLSLLVFMAFTRFT